MKHRPRSLALLGLAFLALFILRDVLFFGQAFFERDLVWLYHSEVEAFVRAIGEGALPLRDSTTGFGQPLLGSPDTEVLYPPAWLHLLARQDRAYSFMVLFHFLVGAAGAAALGRRISGSWWAGFVAGSSWMASGPFQSALNLWHHFAGTAWMPWVLLAFDRLLERPDGRRVLLLGSLFGAQILAGSGDLCMMTLLLCLLRWLSEGPGLAEQLPRRLASVVGSGVVALALGAGVWLSALEIVKASGRTTLSREARTEWSVHPLVAAEFVLPVQVGSLPLSDESIRLLTDGRPLLLKTLFLGPLILPLIVAGLLSKRISRAHRVFLGVGLVCLLLGALGRYTPFYDLVVTLFPPLKLLRFPVKAAIPLSLMACLLAGAGASTSARSRAGRAGLATALLVLIIDVAVLVQAPGLLAPFLDSTGPPMIAAALVRVTSGLLWCGACALLFGGALISGRENLVRGAIALGLGAALFVNRETNFTVPREAMRFRPAQVDTLKDPEPGRLYTVDYLLHTDHVPQVLDPRSPLSPELFIATVRSAFMAPTGGAWGIEYGWDYNQKSLFDPSLAILTQLLHHLEGRPALLRLLQLGNVTRVADFFPVALSGLTLERSLPLPAGEPIHLYRVEGALPRAYAVSGSRNLDPPEAQAMILNPQFDPRAEVVIGQGPARPISPTFTSTVKITARRSDRIALEATLNEPGYVVLIEGVLPGWRAEVDGASVPVLRANAVFLAIETGAGAHRIVFSYRPPLALIGVGLTLLSALGVLSGLALLGSRRHGQPR